MLGDFFSEFIFSGESHFRRCLENFFCSGESIPFRRCSKKVFFEDFCFVLENQSHSEDALIADGFMFGYRICGTLSLLRQKRGREERREKGEIPPKRRLHCAAKDTPRHTHTQSLRNKTMDV
jgi:hypothetical protein